MSFSYIDLVLVLPIAWGAYKGFSKGLILSLTSFAALILGLFGAAKFSNYTAEYIQQYADLNQQIVPLVAFVATFILIAIAIFFIGKSVEKFAQLIALGLVNKIGGLVFGMVRSALIIGVLIIFINKADSKAHFIPLEQKENSLLYEPLLNSTASVVSVMSNEAWYNEYVAPQLQKTKEVKVNIL